MATRARGRKMVNKNQNRNKRLSDSLEESKNKVVINNEESDSDGSDEELSRIASLVGKQMSTYMLEAKNTRVEITESADTSSPKSVKHNKEHINTSSREKTSQQNGLQLSSTIHVDMDSQLYVDVDDYEAPSKTTISIDKSEKEIMKKSVLTPDFEKKNIVPPYSESVRQVKKQRKKERDMSKGKEWFDMKAPEMTEERKNDLMLLKMRGAMEPGHFYKSSDIRALPKFFQVGTVVDNPIDFYHSRIPMKQRKRTLVDELLADAEFRRYNRRKYTEIINSKPRQSTTVFRRKNQKKKY